MLRTSFYLDKYSVSTVTSDSEDDYLFDDQYSDQKLIQWIKSFSTEYPEIVIGLENNDIVSWFLQSFYILPAALGMSFTCTDLVSALEFFKSKKVFRDETIRYLKKSSRTAPPPKLIYAILNDISSIELTKTAIYASDPKGGLMMTVDSVNARLKELGVTDQPRYTPKFLVDLFNSMYHEKASASTIDDALFLFVEKEALDPSFLKAGKAIESKDSFIWLQLISSILSNYHTDIPVPVKTPIESNIQNGLSLVKLLLTLDSDFAQVTHIFDDPRNPAECRWNVRKCVEFLMERENWPKSLRIDASSLFKGDPKQLYNLAKGICKCYRDTIHNKESERSVCEYLGIKTVNELC